MVAIGALFFTLELKKAAVTWVASRVIHTAAFKLER